MSRPQLDEEIKVALVWLKRTRRRRTEEFESPNVKTTPELFQRCALLQNLVSYHDPPTE
jgi:hypothetical protein